MYRREDDHILQGIQLQLTKKKKKSYTFNGFLMAKEIWLKLKLIKKTNKKRNNNKSKLNIKFKEKGLKLKTISKFLLLGNMKINLFLLEHQHSL